MKLFLILIVLFFCEMCSPVIGDQKLEESVLTGKLGHNKKQFGNLKIDASKIKYNIFRKGSSKGSVVYSTDVSKLKNTRFDESLENVYIIHGWTNNNVSRINRNIRDALLSKHNVNIFVVDWSKYSRLDYISALLKVGEVGVAVADFIQQTVKHFNVSLDKVRLVGFSLGAHVAGSAGAALKGEIASITGLDPAGPGFSKSIPSTRLDPTDAKYVTAIHTNAGVLGCNFAVGHSDFWPNGGLRQSGCVVDLAGICSHNRVHDIYAESLTDNKFVASKCASYVLYSIGACKNAETSHMGGLHPNTKAAGDFYLDTNSRSPYGKN